MFHIGDKVVYPMHGAGVIYKLEEKEILGEVKKYYILKMPIGNICIAIPMDRINDMGIRDVIDPSDCEKVILTLRGGRTNMPDNWNKRYQENLEKMKSGDVFEIANVVRNLSILDNMKGLSTGEKKMLNTAKKMIVSELVIVEDKTPEAVEKIIDEAITLAVV